MKSFKYIIFSFLVSAASAEQKVIVLDPGHESWTQSSWVKSGEAQANLKFAKSLEEIIKKEGKYEVISTLDERGYNPLLKRFEKKFRKRIHTIRRAYENRHHPAEGYYQMLHVRSLFFHHRFNYSPADVFVSIHHNEPGDGRDYHGFCIYYTYHGKAAQEAKELAVVLRDALVSNGYGTSTNGGEKNGYTVRDFAVLHHATETVAAVLMELGYISNKEDKEAAYTDTSVGKKASIVYKVLDDFLSRRK